MAKVAWKSLKHATGPATKVPAQVDEILAGRDWSDRSAAYHTLESCLLKGRKWFGASGPAVELLLEQAPKSEHGYLLVMLAASVIGAGQLQAWVESAGVKLRPGEAEVRAAAAKHREALFSWLVGADAQLAGAAAMTLAMLPEIASASTPKLLAAVHDGQSDIVRAGALLALARIAPDSTRVVTAIEDLRRSGTPAVVRGAAALAWLRLSPDHPFSAVRSELEDLLHAERAARSPWFYGWPWFDRLAFSDEAPRALVELAQARGREAEAELSDVAFDVGTKTKDGSVQTQATKVCLGLAGFSGMVMYDGEVALLDELAPPKRTLALRMAPTNLLPCGGLGLPASGAVRRRWAGLEPAGPLDELVDKGRSRVPRWRLWSKQEEPNPMKIGPVLERFEAIVQFAAWSYPSKWFHREATLEQDIAALPDSADTVALIERLADDLSARRAAQMHTGGPIFPCLTVGALLLLPLVRSGRALEPRWDALVPCEQHPASREILSALPVERREAVLCAEVDARPFNLPRDVIELVDLAPTPRVVDRIRRQLDLFAGDWAWGMDVPPLIARLEERVAAART